MYVSLGLLFLVGYCSIVIAVCVGWFLKFYRFEGFFCKISHHILISLYGDFLGAVCFRFDL